MKIRFLGTSGSGVNLTRNLPAILIDDQILVDCGEGTLQGMLKNHIPITNLRYILLSHLHADHCLGLISLLWKFAFYSQKDPNLKVKSIPIYLPWGMKEKLIEILQNTYSTFNKVSYFLDIRELPVICTEPVQLQLSQGNTTKYSLEWVQTKHTPICYAYKFQKRLVISGDSSPDRKVTKFCAGIHTLIHEATFFDNQGELAHRLNHSTPSDAAKIAHHNSITKLFLTHLPPLKENEIDYFLNEAKQIFPNTVVANDGDIIELN